MARYYDGERWVSDDDQEAAGSPFDALNMRKQGYMPDVGLGDWKNTSGAGGRRFNSILDYYKYLYGDGVTPEQVNGETWYKTPNGADAILPGRTQLYYNPPDSRGSQLTKAGILALASAGLTGNLPGTENVFSGMGGGSGWTSGFDLPAGGVSDAAWGVNPADVVGSDWAAGLPGTGNAGLGGGMDWGNILDGLKTADLVRGGLSLASGLMGQNATNRATDAQVGASNAAIAEQRRQYDQTRMDQMPFMRSGYAANERLARLLGIDPAQASEAGYGDLTRKFTANDLNADPVYQSGLQFGLDEGRKGINARATATGNWDSGATLKALTRYGNDYGSTKANDSFNRFNTENTNIYNRLAGITGAGQTATNNVSASGANTSGNISNLETGAGNARAAGIVGGNNAWTTAIGGVNSVLNDAESRAIIDRLLRRQ